MRAKGTIMSHQNAFPKMPTKLRLRRRSKSWLAEVSPQKILRLTVVLMMSFLCWLGIGCFAFEMFQLVGH
jgi:hypothetical protein